MSQTDEELVDIIDENNNVRQTVPKSVAHRDGLLHRTVIAQLKNSKGDFCFVRQASDRQDAGQFVSPIGGHVSAGESVEEALIRESQEEVGLKPSNYKIVGQFVYYREVIGRKENHLFIVYEIETDQDPVLNHESVEFKWFTQDEIKKAVATHDPLFGDAWHEVFNKLGLN